MSRNLGYYDGSLLLTPIADLLHVPIDQVNFVICSVVCLFLGYIYRTTFAPERQSTTTRNVIQIVFGLPIAYFCFGAQIYHVVLQTVTCYLVMRYVKEGIMAKLVLVVALGYLCIAHMYRQYFDYGSFVMDITGPLMVNVERLSSLAFGIADGRVKHPDKLTPMMRKYIVRRLPSPLELCSYVFSFHNFMCGPFAFYNDYVAFIDGSNYQAVNKQDFSNGNVKGPVVDAPSPAITVVKKMLVFLLAMALTVFLAPHLYFPQHASVFHEYSFARKIYYMVVCTTICRQKYYCAWKISEAINLNAGLGFNGYDEEGIAKWDLIDNIQIRQIEFSTSLKMVIDKWNIMTAKWLRYTVYERYPSQAAVFALSAFWHGFYGGYYVMFATTCFFVHTGREIRRNVRPLFQSSARMRALYEVLTFIGKTLALGYLSFPFVMLDAWASILVYNQMYFFLHIAAVLTIVFFKFVKLPTGSRQPASTMAKENGSASVSGAPTTSNGTSAADTKRQ